MHPSLARLARRANRRVLPSRLLYGPSWVILGVNNVCNLHCRMCDVGTGEEGSNFYQHMTGADPVQMPEALARRVIDQLATSFPKAKLGFAFTEPSVWPPLVAAVGEAARRGVFTSVTTNGLLLPKLAGPLAAAGLDELAVSIDGPAEIHDAIRRRAGSFDRAIAGIRAALDTPRPPRVSVFCAVTEWNIGHFATFLEALRPLRLERVGFMHTVYVSEAAATEHNSVWGARYSATPSNTRELALDRYDLDALWAEMIAIRGMALPFPVSWSPELGSRAELERYYRDPAPFGRRCADAFENVMVKSDGTVIPAHSRCFPVVGGNVYEQDLAEIWNAPAFGRLRADLLAAGGLFPGCSRCCSAR